jgi:class 3 adenylate cyclase
VRENGGVARTALCPDLIRRDDELGVLEDALLAARRGESGFVVLAGEAGIGKTRLSRELAREARELGCAVLSGGASDAEVSLPYLPFVEAIGNYLDEQDLDALREALGPALGELGQLFPTLGGDRGPEPSPDPGQAKLRLFEAIVSLLALPARDRTLLLVIEDVHWADASTRELLDYLARRLTDLPSLIVVTYRTDELHRRHPFLPTLQGWRRSGVAEVLELEPLSADGIAEMLAAIVGQDEVDPELRELMLERTEGNPFVLEEILCEVMESSGSGDGLDREAVSRIRLPESVRHAILLRVQRLGEERAAVLETGAALGRSFDHRTLQEVSAQPESTVQDALEAAIAQQLIEEDPGRHGRYSWRHALTQEAIYAETITPRRQAIHSRAADVLGRSETTRPVELASHLLGAARFEEAVPVCLRSAEEAENALAFGEAISLLERALPYVDDPLERARVLCRIGRDQWRNGKPATAVGFLTEGIQGLEGLSETLEAARHRIVLGRCQWECERPPEARAEYERALEILETAGPSAELSMAHNRLAGLYAFELDYRNCIESARRAVEIAEQAGADLERVWALAFVALGYLDSGEIERGFAVMDDCFREAQEKGYSQIAHNVGWNDIWTRTHTMQSGLEERIERMEAQPYRVGHREGDSIALSYVQKARGDLEGGLESAQAAISSHEHLGYSKMAWRAKVQAAEVLAELGRGEEAEEILPTVSSRTELQDIVYDTGARIRVSQSLGRPDEALSVAEEIQAEADRLAFYRETLALAAEVFAVAGRRESIEDLAVVARDHPTTAGSGYLDEIEGRLALGRGDAAEAADRFRSAVVTAAAAGYPLVELRVRTLLARALAAEGAEEEAAGELKSVTDQAAKLRARLIIREAAEAARGELAIEPPVAPEEPAAAAPGMPVVPQGERLVTSLFADVRGYAELGASLTPGALAERMAMLYRLARVAVERRQGIVDKFAGDAVMATFNVSGTSTDHCVDAVEAALALRDRAATIELPLGIGISVGPGIVGRGAADDNIAVTGEATNLAARLQAQAGSGEILLSAEAHRRVADWLEHHGMDATEEELELKGFADPQVVHRIPVLPAVEVAPR